MVVKSQPYYWIECDECGESSTEGGDFAAWGDVGQAMDDATNGEWWFGDKGGKQLCYEHAPKCEECRQVQESDGTLDCGCAEAES